MCQIYKLKGFISVEFDDSEPEVPLFLVTPDQAYLSPCRQYAVGFQYESDLLNAMGFKLDDGKLRKLSVSSPQADWVSHLVNIALQQKPVLIHINDKKIVGFSFPAN
jgi:hypothetical protein